MRRYGKPAAIREILMPQTGFPLIDKKGHFLDTGIHIRCGIPGLVRIEEDHDKNIQRSTRSLYCI